jgi:hypothetical protein
MGPLPPYRQTAPMAQTPVTSQVHKALDIHGDFPAEVAFHLAGTVNGLADAGNLGIIELSSFSGAVNPGLLKQFDRGGAPDAENISEGNVNSFVTG